jgi:hypothetical protein
MTKKTSEPKKRGRKPKVEAKVEIKAISETRIDMTIREIIKLTKNVKTSEQEFDTFTLLDKTLKRLNFICQPN